MGASIPAAPLRDALPQLIFIEDSVWVHCARVRDRIFEQFLAAAAKHGIKALVLRSPPHIYPVWVSFESWLPVGECTRTARFRIVIQFTPLAHRRFPIRLEVELHDCGVDGRVNTRFVSPADLFGRRSLINDRTIDQVVAYAAGVKVPLPYLFRWTWEDFLINASTGRNEIESFRRRFVWVFNPPIWIAILTALVFPLIGVPLLIWSVFRHIKRRKQGEQVRDAGRPGMLPRDLIMMDSWFTLVHGLGARSEDVRREMAASLAGTAGPETECSIETIMAWGLDFLEERDQVVVRRRRALVFCHIYCYGDDLYVGWDSHLNLGEWRERELQSGFDRTIGFYTRATDVVAENAVPTLYHFSDLDSLTEWVHTRIAALVKRLLAEYKIDQKSTSLCSAASATQL